jgi:hypothetical protein
MHEIRIATEKIEMLATLNESDTAERIWDALPIESAVNTWGQEIYFSVPVQCDLSLEARDRMEIGEVAYWPTGSAFCIFFGRTPASKGDEPRAASPVNPIGRCEGDIKVFRQIREGNAIRIERIEEPADEEPPTEAAGEPTEAAAEPAEAAGEPTEAAGEPPEAASEPTEAAGEPAEAADNEKPAEEV